MLFNIMVIAPDGRVLRELNVRRGTYTIGRTQTTDIQLPSQSVSREHARLVIQGSRAAVEDLGSANGIVVNGQHTRGRVDLDPVSSIIIGEFAINIRAMPEDTIQLPQGEPLSPDDAESPRFVRIGDAWEGRVYPLLGDGIIIGRGEDSSIRIDHESVSRKHARILAQGPAHVVVDLQSANGTRVNGNPINTALLLREGDIVQFGDVTLIYARKPGAPVLRGINPAGGDAATASPTSLLVFGGVSIVVVLVAVLLFALVNRREQVAVAPAPSAAAPAAATAAAPAAPAAFDPAPFRAQMAAGQWAAAVTGLEAFLATRPDHTEARALLDTARKERDAANNMRRCQSEIDAAHALEAGGQTLAAVETFDRARTCLGGVPEGTRARTEADIRRSDVVLPAMTNIYRNLAAQAISGRDYAGAVQSIEKAAQLAREQNKPSLADDLAGQLRNALLFAADDAYTRKAWLVAAESYRRANDITPLDAARARRLAEARKRAGN